MASLSLLKIFDDAPALTGLKAIVTDTALQAQLTKGMEDAIASGKAGALEEWAGKAAKTKGLSNEAKTYLKSDEFKVAMRQVDAASAFSRDVVEQMKAGQRPDWDDLLVNKHKILTAAERAQVKRGDFTGIDPNVQKLLETVVKVDDYWKRQTTKKFLDTKFNGVFPDGVPEDSVIMGAAYKAVGERIAARAERGALKDIGVPAAEDVGFWNSIKSKFPWNKPSATSPQPAAAPAQAAAPQPAAANAAPNAQTAAPQPAAANAAPVIKTAAQRKVELASEMETTLRRGDSVDFDALLQKHGISGTSQGMSQTRATLVSFEEEVARRAAGDTRNIPDPEKLKSARTRLAEERFGPAPQPTAATAQAAKNGAKVLEKAPSGLELPELKTGANYFNTIFVKWLWKPTNIIGNWTHTIKSAPTDPTPIVRKVINFVDDTMDKHGITQSVRKLEAEFDDLSVRLKADPNQRTAILQQTKQKVSEFAFNNRAKLADLEKDLDALIAKVESQTLKRDQNGQLVTVGVKDGGLVISGNDGSVHALVHKVHPETGVTIFSHVEPLLQSLRDVRNMARDMQKPDFGALGERMRALDTISDNGALVTEMSNALNLVTEVARGSELRMHGLKLDAAKKAAKEGGEAEKAAYKALKGKSAYAQSAEAWERSITEGYWNSHSRLKKMGDTNIEHTWLSKVELEYKNLPRDENGDIKWGVPEIGNFAANIGSIIAKNYDQEALYGIKMLMMRRGFHGDRTMPENLASLLSDWGDKNGFKGDKHFASAVDAIRKASDISDAAGARKTLFAQGREAQLWWAEKTMMLRSARRFRGDGTFAKPFTIMAQKLAGDQVAKAVSYVLGGNGTVPITDSNVWLNVRPTWGTWAGDVKAGEAYDNSWYSNGITRSVVRLGTGGLMEPAVNGHTILGRNTHVQLNSWMIRGFYLPTLTLGGAYAGIANAFEDDPNKERENLVGVANTLLAPTRLGWATAPTLIGSGLVLGGGLADGTTWIATAGYSKLTGEDKTKRFPFIHQAGFSLLDAAGDISGFADKNFRFGSTSSGSTPSIIPSAHAAGGEPAGAVDENTTRQAAAKGLGLENEIKVKTPEEGLILSRGKAANAIGYGAVEGTLQKADKVYNGIQADINALSQEKLAIETAERAIRSAGDTAKADKLKLLSQQVQTQLEFISKAVPEAINGTHSALKTIDAQIAVLAKANDPNQAATVNMLLNQQRMALVELETLRQREFTQFLAAARDARANGKHLGDDTALKNSPPNAKKAEELAKVFEEQLTALQEKSALLTRLIAAEGNADKKAKLEKIKNQVDETIKKSVSDGKAPSEYADTIIEKYNAVLIAHNAAIGKLGYAGLVRSSDLVAKQPAALKAMEDINKTLAGQNAVNEASIKAIAPAAAAAVDATRPAGAGAASGGSTGGAARPAAAGGSPAGGGGSTPAPAAALPPEIQELRNVYAANNYPLFIKQQAEAADKTFAAATEYLDKVKAYHADIAAKREVPEGLNTVLENVTQQAQFAAAARKALQDAQQKMTDLDAQFMAETSSAAKAKLITAQINELRETAIRAQKQAREAADAIDAIKAANPNIDDFASKQAKDNALKAVGKGLDGGNGLATRFLGDGGPGSAISDLFNGVSSGAKGFLNWWQNDVGKAAKKSGQTGELMYMGASALGIFALFKTITNFVGGPLKSLTGFDINGGLLGTLITVGIGLYALRGTSDIGNRFDAMDKKNLDMRGGGLLAQTGTGGGARHVATVAADGSAAVPGISVPLVSANSVGAASVQDLNGGVPRANGSNLSDASAQTGGRGIHIAGLQSGSTVNLMGNVNGGEAMPAHLAAAANGDRYLMAAGAPAG